MNRIVEIVVDGGPGAGKSSVLKRARELESEDTGIIIVPETATEVFNAGVSPGGKYGLSNEEFQMHILFMQIEKERWYRRIAERYKNKKIVILLKDRSTMSGSAYLPPGQLEAMIRKLGISVSELRDINDGVIHLVTAAIGAENSYTTANNTARTESPEKAASLDGRTRETWIGCPHLRVIESRADFEEKILNTLKAIRHFAGIPRSLEIERRFLLGYLGYSDMVVVEAPYNVKVVKVFMEQVYLKHEVGKPMSRIRKRVCGGFSLYYHTQKSGLEAGAAIEDESRINGKEYNDFFENERDETRNVIHKRRHYFLWKNQYFELDIFEKPERLKGLAILEIELIDKNEPVEIPPFFYPLREVTGIEGYSTASLAKKR